MVEAIEKIRGLPSAEPKTGRDCTNFVRWLMDEVMDEENWQLNAVANGEIICRKLKKLGLLDVVDGYYVETQKTGEWIPCSERLPEPNRHDELNVDVYYLAQTEFGDMIVASYNESHEGTKWWELIYSYRIFDDEIVAWMPLPEKYKRGENE